MPKQKYAAEYEDDFVINYQGTSVHANEIEFTEQVLQSSAYIL